MPCAADEPAAAGGRWYLAGPGHPPGGTDHPDAPDRPPLPRPRAHPGGRRLGAVDRARGAGRPGRPHAAGLRGRARVRPRAPGSCDPTERGQRDDRDRGCTGDRAGRAAGRRRSRRSGGHHRRRELAAVAGQPRRLRDRHRRAHSHAHRRGRGHPLLTGPTCRRPAPPPRRHRARHPTPSSATTSRASAPPRRPSVSWPRSTCTRSSRASWPRVPGTTPLRTATPWGRSSPPSPRWRRTTRSRGSRSRGGPPRSRPPPPTTGSSASPTPSG